MKLMRCVCVLWLIFTGAMVFRLSAQPSVEEDEADRKWFRETKAKAESGSAEAQNNLGSMYSKGQGVAKNFFCSSATINIRSIKECVARFVCRYQRSATIRVRIGLALELIARSGNAPAAVAKATADE